MTTAQSTRTQHQEPVQTFGRSAELTRMVRFLSGGGSAMILLGDAGVGKSNLVSAAAGRSPDVTVLSGYCLPLSVRLPLLPLIDAFRQLVQLEGALLAAVRSDWPDWVMTELGRVMPELNDNRSATPGPAPDAAWQQQRLFDALGYALRSLGAQRSVALIVEDLQWADQTTLDWLEYILAPSHRCGVPLVVTCRTDDPGPLPTEWLTRVEALPAVARMQLRELDEQATALQVNALVPPNGVAAHHLGRAVFSRSQGNPFFTEQLVAHLGRSESESVGSTGLPGGLSALLRSRLSNLPAATADVVAGLAVAGGILDEARLAGLVGRDLTEVRTALHDARARRLLRGDGTSADSAELRHALLGEAVKTGLPAARLRLLHGRLADQLIALGAPGQAGQIAEHLQAAERTESELNFRIRAGHEAEATLAGSEAAAHYHRAIALWKQPPTYRIASSGDDAGPIGLIDVYERAASTTENAGDRSEANRLAREALLRCGPTADDTDRARLHLGVAHFWPMSSAAEGAAALDLVLQSVGTGPAEKARAHREYAVLLLSTGRFAASRAHIAAAIEVAREQGAGADRRILSIMDAWLLAALGDEEASAGAADSALALDRGDAAAALEFASRYSDLLIDSGQLGPAVELGRVEIAAAEACGLGGSYWMDVLRYNTFEALVERGAVTDAVAVLAARNVDGTGHGGFPVEWARADADLRRGDVDGAGRYWLGASLAGGAGTSVRREYHLRRLEWGLWSGNIEPTLSDAVECVVDICATDQSQFVGPLLVLTLRGAGTLAGRARAVGDRRALSAALDLGQRLDEVLRGAPSDPFAPRLVPRAAAAHGLTWRAERSRLRGRSDPEAWTEAAQAWDRLERPPRSAYARWRGAQSLLEHRRRRGDALVAVTAAERDSRSHQPLHNSVRLLASRAHLSLPEPEGPIDATAAVVPTAAAVEPTGLAGAALTGREAQVLQLLTTGRTNAQIGAALYISPKTAGVHVTNILRKLGVSSRVEAAAIADRASHGRPEASGAPVSVA